VKGLAELGLHQELLWMKLDIGVSYVEAVQLVQARKTDAKRI